MTLKVENSMSADENNPTDDSGDDRSGPRAIALLVIANAGDGCQPGTFWRKWADDGSTSI